MIQQEFDGRKIIVFGASSGIGSACAIQLGEQGANVILVGRNMERLEETAGHIPEGRRTILPCDVSDFDAARAVVEDAVELDGAKLDGCVFSAGVSTLGTITAIREPLLLEIFRTNLFSLYGILKVFSSRRISRDGASFVSISSMAAFMPTKGQSIYAGTKGAINSITIGVAKELAKRRIRVNTICPAMADTPMGAAYLERMEEGRYPLGKLMPEDIADAVLFLLSNASKKITGQAIQITAGDIGGNDNFVF